jgi:hypothetical protein
MAMSPRRALPTERCLRMCPAIVRWGTHSERRRTCSLARSSLRTQADHPCSWRCCKNRLSTRTWRPQDRLTARRSPHLAHRIGRLHRTSAAKESCRSADIETGCKLCRRPSHRPAARLSRRRRSSTCRRGRHECDSSMTRPTSYRRSGCWRHTYRGSTCPHPESNGSQSRASCPRTSHLMAVAAVEVAAAVAAVVAGATATR